LEAARAVESRALTAPAQEGPVRAKPPVRKLARDLGVDLRSLTPSGPDDTVTRDDVHAAGRHRCAVVRRNASTVARNA
jgi:pyruvate dehydrogenase E2 component (dihydrolipoamide acetyltransferase)